MNSVFNDISEDFPNSDKIYLNNASVSLMPLTSIEAMRDFLIDYNSIGPDSVESTQFIAQKLQNIRKTISKIINCKPEEIVLTQSTTDGINIVANGISFKHNSNLIIRGSTHEHHANYYPWLRLQNKTKIKSLSIDKNGFFDFDEFEKFLDEKTSLVALSHALYNTGSILPVEKAGKILHDKKIPFFLDSAQTVGCIENVDVSKINCNFMSFNGSKWLCGPMGTGLFYCNKKSSALLEPVTIGGESAMVYDENNLAFKDIPDKFQTGFRNYAGIVGLESSANYLQKLGINNIRKKNLFLSKILRDELSKIQKITLYGHEDPEKRTSIVSFTINDIKSQDAVEKLEKEKIILAVREIFDTKIIRASPHFFNTESEILRVVNAIKNL